MTKCDFCTKSYPNGECWWHFKAAAEDDCRKAIKMMTKAFQNENIIIDKKKKKEWW